MKTLLLDKNYKPISFISYRKTIKLIIKEKVEVISEWENEPFYNDKNYPSVMILKEYIRKKPIIPHFSFKGVFLRDNFCCQYTGVKLPPSRRNIDHVIPKSRGGESSWENCVTSSFDVNFMKGNRTPEEAGLKLLRKPCTPKDPLALEFSSLSEINNEWKVYFPGIEINSDID